MNIHEVKGIPLYVQIREELRMRIVNHELKIGTQLPSENDLAEHFGVSRMTLRKAVDDLVSDGMLLRKQGVGTIVASEKVIRDYSALFGFYEDARNSGYSPFSKLLSKEVIKANRKIANAIAVSEGEPIFHISRLRYLSGDIPPVLHDVYVSKSLCPWLEDDTIDLEKESLYHLYETHGLTIHWAKQLVEARVASKSEAELLSYEVGGPLLYFERIIYTQENLPIEMVIALNPGDHYSVDLVLKR